MFINPITLSVTKNFAILFWRHIHSRMGLYVVSRTVSYNLQRMLLAFCISPNVWSLYTNKLCVHIGTNRTQQTIVSQIVMGCAYVCMVTAYSYVKLTCQPNLFDVELYNFCVHNKKKFGLLWKRPWIFPVFYETKTIWFSCSNHNRW